MQWNKCDIAVEEINGHLFFSWTVKRFPVSQLETRTSATLTGSPQEFVHLHLNIKKSLKSLQSELQDNGSQWLKWAHFKCVLTEMIVTLLHTTMSKTGYSLSTEAYNIHFVTLWCAVRWHSLSQNTITKEASHVPKFILRSYYSKHDIWRHMVFYEKSLGKW